MNQDDTQYKREHGMEEMKKRGRPSTGIAKTSAERSADYRARKAAELTEREAKWRELEAEREALDKAWCAERGMDWNEFQEVRREASRNAAQYARDLMNKLLEREADEEREQEAFCVREGIDWREVKKYLNRQKGDIKKLTKEIEAMSADYHRMEALKKREAVVMDREAVLAKREALVAERESALAIREQLPVTK